MLIARPSVLAPALLGLASPVLSAQTLLHEISPPDLDCSSRFGSALDLEGGLLLTVSELSDQSFMARVYLYDANSGDELWRIDSPAPPAFGDAVELVGERALVGSSAEGGGSGVGRVKAFSTVDGSFLGNLDAPAAFPGARFGYSLAEGGGRLAVGDPRFDSDAGIVHLYDATSGVYLESIPSPEGAEHFGESVALEGDLLIVGAPEDSFPYLSPASDGAAYLFDLAQPGSAPVSIVPSLVGNAGVDVALNNGIPTVVGIEGTDQTGHGVLHGGAAFPASSFEWDESDLGIPPVRVVDAGGGRTYLGGVLNFSPFVLSGAVTAIVPDTGERLYTLFSPESVPGVADMNLFGAEVAADDDLLAVQDLRYPKPEGASSQCSVGTVYIYDATPDFPLITTPIGIDEVGVEELLLRDDPSVASGDLYLLVGGISGTNPGVVLNGVQVPLNLDLVTDYFLVNANGPGLENTFGTWGPDAVALSQLSVPVPVGLPPVELVLLSIETTGGLSVRAASAPTTY